MSREINGRINIETRLSVCVPRDNSYKLLPPNDVKLHKGYNVNFDQDDVLFVFYLRCVKETIIHINTHIWFDKLSLLHEISADMQLNWFPSISLQENHLIYCYIPQYIITTWIVPKVNVTKYIAITIDKCHCNSSVNVGCRQYIYIYIYFNRLKWPYEHFTCNDLILSIFVTVDGKWNGRVLCEWCNMWIESCIMKGNKILPPYRRWWQWGRQLQDGFHDESINIDIEWRRRYRFIYGSLSINHNC